ncbi:MAG: hypothetical protein KKD33_01480, partial [Verrucomicrobia bacterium]|nr:hypothetical protein [Verrucomicrobiota bacterium]
MKNLLARKPVDRGTFSVRGWGGIKRWIAQGHLMEEKGNYMKKTDRRTTQTRFDIAVWKTLSAEYRPIPFWVWNEKQEPEELKRQIAEMHRQRFGGFFIHARLGLKTAYLGDKWFEHVRLSLAEARRLGMQAWIYDDDRWPSGYASGKTAETPGLDYPAYGLICRKDAGRESFEIIRSPRSIWLNNTSDPDLLNPDVTSAFLKITHKEYRRRFGKYFAKTVPGFFTDEPSYVMWGHDEKFRCIPWTGKMEEIFRKRRGYELKPYLKSLFSDIGDFRKVRLDFYQTVTEQFRDSYAKKLFDWCGKQGVASTGHVMMEETLLSQVQAVGATMPHYEYLQVPGIDGLGYELPGSPLVSKQCVSVARQLGQNRVLGELFGGAGWEIPLGKLKPLGDYYFALGVNLLNQHLAYYSIRGCRKRDYPNSCSYHQPGYDLYGPFNDYYSRLSYALTRGKPVSRILILHPIASAWALYTPGNPEPVKELDRQFAELSNSLLRCQRDYDYGDELLMQKQAEVVDGKLAIGQMSYDAVMVPPAETWSSHTFALLQKFASQGGKIIAVGCQATFLAGRPSCTLAAFLTGSAVLPVKQATPVALEKALAFLPPDIRVRAENGKLIPELIYQHRTDGRRELYFLTFGGRKKEFRASVTLEGEGAVELLNPENGAIEPLPAHTEKGMTQFEITIPAQGSCLIMLKRGAVSQEKAFTVQQPERQPLDGTWRVTRLEPNVLLIDRCRLKCFKSDWSEPMGITGMIMPNAQGVLQNAFDKKLLWPDWPIDLRLEFRADLPQGDKIDPWLVIENPASFISLSANRQALAVDNNSWWLDRQFRKVGLHKSLRPGVNRINYRFKWASPTLPHTLKFTPEGVELENAYIIGNFNVSWKGPSARIVPAQALPTDPSTDLAKHGLPF